MYVIGLDPASAGAAVLIETAPPGGSHSVIGVWAWKLRQRDGRKVYELSGWRSTGPQPLTLCVPTPGLLGSAIARQCTARPDVIVIEGAYVGRSAHTSLRIARFGGLVAGGMQAAYGHVNPPSTVEVAPTTWRTILGLQASGRAAAKERALEGMPLLLPSLKTPLEVLGGVDHVADAGGVALVGAALNGWEPGFDDRVRLARRRR